MGDVSSLDAMEFLNESYTQRTSISQWFYGTEEGETGTKFFNDALLSKAKLIESC